MHFIVDEGSPALKIFSPEGQQDQTAGGWNGEHAGKWLYAAARAADRTGDHVLKDRVLRVADYLVKMQGSDGYLGTYTPEFRFMNDERERKLWDVWVLGYAMAGLLEVNRYFPNPAYVEAARKVADLCQRTFAAGRTRITDCGNHHGLSATVLIDPVMDLYSVTGEPRYLEFARFILKAADKEPALKIVSSGLAGKDLQQVGDGKVYQICWNLVGIAKLAEATGDADLRKLVRLDWDSIRLHHLTIEGGPWGGIGIPSPECFNARNFFSPEGIVETCSVMSWIQLNRELLRATGDARYAEEIERSAYNALIGAEDPNGEDWCYYAFPNGQRVNTYYWACCKSSGAIALEELPPIAYGLVHEGRDVAVNLYGPSGATLVTASAGQVALKQVTNYPFSGNATIEVTPSRTASFHLLLRVPTWAEGASIRVNGAAVAGTAIKPGAYADISRAWQPGDVVQIDMPVVPRLHYQTALKPKPAGNYDYVAVSRGPLIYATGLIDGFKREETLQLPRDGTSALLADEAAPPGFEGTAVRLHSNARPPLLFLPYYEAGGRQNGTWRFTWMGYAHAP